MSKKLSGNTLWEASKMMLPEHREALIQFSNSLRERQRIELDEQEKEAINLAMQQSLKQKREIAINMYDRYEQLCIIGVVERFDAQLRRFMVDGEWFYLKDVERVEDYTL